MSQDWGPVSPEKAALLDYWGGQPGQNMSDAGAPPPAPPPPPPPGPADYFGPAPLPDGGMSGGPPVNASVPPPQGPQPPPMSLDPRAVKEMTFGAQGGSPPPPPPDGSAIRFGKPVVVDGKAGIAPFRRPDAPPGGSGGGPGNPDPFGVKAGQKGILGAYDSEKAATLDEERAHAAGMLERAEKEQQLAREKEEDSAILNQHQAQFEDRFGKEMEEAQRQLQEVREMKVDPLAAEREAGVGSIQAVIGGLIGGLYQGVTKSAENPFLAQLNKTIDRKISAQEKNINSARSSAEGQFNLLGQMRGSFKDAQTARFQTKQMYYEAAKQRIEAEAAGHDVGRVKADADKAVAGIDLLQKQSAKKFAEEAQARAAAAGAAALAKQKADREWQFKEAEMKHLAAQTALLDAQSKHVGEPKGEEVTARNRERADMAEKLSKLEGNTEYGQVKQLSKYLIDPKTGKVDETRSIPGVGRFADLREAVAPPIGKGPFGDAAMLGVTTPPGAAYTAARGLSSGLVGLDSEERINKGAFDQLRLGFRHKSTGVAGADKELEEINTVWQGVKSPAEVGHAVRITLDGYQRAIDLTQASNPEAAAELKANLREIKQAAGAPALEDVK